MLNYDEESSLYKGGDGGDELLLVLREELADCGIFLVVVLDGEHEHGDESCKIKNKAGES